MLIVPVTHIRLDSPSHTPGPLRLVSQLISNFSSCDPVPCLVPADNHTQSSPCLLYPICDDCVTAGTMKAQQIHSLTALHSSMASAVCLKAQEQQLGTCTSYNTSCQLSLVLISLIHTLVEHFRCIL